jgi:hypothetical protein
MNNVESVERLAKLVKRLNPDQFVSVDVESLVHLLTAHKMLEKLPDAVKQQYSIASELDADKWDAEFREKFRGPLTLASNLCKCGHYADRHRVKSPQRCGAHACHCYSFQIATELKKAGKA